MSSVMQDGFEKIGGNIAQTSERIIESINQVDSTIKLSTPDMKSIEARHERALEMLDCSCALNSDHLCSLNFDQVERPARRGAGCG